MKIGVVADTHSKPIPGQLINDFKKVDFIVHAGDFCQLADVEILEKIKEVKGVYGNMDDINVRRKFPARIIFQVEKFRIGVFHGEGPGKKIFSRLESEFKKDKIDVVIFGHSHQPMNEKVGNRLYFNPGSPTDDIIAPYMSYGILEITDVGISGKIIKVK